MAGFVFRLQSYLGVKEKIEEQKKLEYGKSLAKLEQDRQVKVMLLQERDSNIVSFKNSILNGVKPNELSRYNEYIDFVKVKIKKQDEVIKKSENEAEVKRLELVEAMKERKMLEKLRERDKEKYMKEELLKEQKITDEIVSYQYNDKG